MKTIFRATSVLTARDLANLLQQFFTGLVQRLFAHMFQRLSATLRCSRIGSFDELLTGIQPNAQNHHRQHPMKVIVNRVALTSAEISALERQFGAKLVCCLRYT